MTFILAALLLAALAVWVCLSPARAAVAAVPMVATHPVLTLTITAVVAGLVLTVGALVVVRSLRESGWRLINATPNAALAEV